MLAMDKGNLEQVRNAFTPSIESVRQPYPFKEWYMVLVRPNHEQDAADSFRRNQVRAYWPNYERFQTFRDCQNKPQRRTVLTGILPGYIFTPGSPTEDLTRLIERVTGVINIVRTFSGNPLFLSEIDIDIIRKIEVGLNTPEPLKPVHNFKMREKVRFADDLVGRWPPGKISKLAKDGRISVEVELMGRKVSVIVFPHQIERV
jgi:transcription antitermination factor NusG